MRFGPSDDCSSIIKELNQKDTVKKSLPEITNCKFIKKSTHYHCMKCSKVYTSTSDVMTHENFHKKAEKIINEGFQKFKSGDNCDVENCNFSELKIAHFHCMKENCKMAFKSKVEMEKHRNFHKNKSSVCEEISKDSCRMNFNSQNSQNGGNSNLIEYFQKIISETNNNSQPQKIQKKSPKAAQKIKNGFNYQTIKENRCGCFLKHVEHFHCPTAKCGAIFPSAEVLAIDQHIRYHIDIEKMILGQ